MPIDSFSGPYRFLSNFYPSPIWMGNLIYPTVEHAYQAAKTDDVQKRAHIAVQITAYRAKAEGRKLHIHPYWDAIKLDVMRQLLVKKFEHEHLMKMLMLTGDQELVEGNYWGDTYWGVCDGRGQNMLGKLLMEIRNNAKTNS